MNTFYAQHRAVARLWAGLTMFAVLLSAFSAPLSFAQAEELPAEPAVESSTPADTDTVDEQKEKKTEDKKETPKEDPLPPSDPAPQAAALVNQPQDNGNPGQGGGDKITICHANESNEQANNPFTKNVVDEEGLNGHGGHPDDIIPVTAAFPNGQNLGTVYGNLTGAQILADNCNTPKPEEPKKEVKISLTKIICEDETLLPNDGYTQITGTTATDFLTANPDCYPAKDWKFQWAKGGVDIQTENAGELGSPWNTTAVTNNDGKVVVTLSEKDVKNQSIISVREVWSDDYIPFTGRTGGPVSAELYCASDAANFDNLEWISNVAVDNTYHCVAWNVPVLEEIEACKYDAELKPIEGWKMTFDNGADTITLETEKDGCVSKLVNPQVGPWTVTEEVRVDWKQVEVIAQNGYVESDNEEEIASCVFYSEYDQVAVALDSNNGDYPSTDRLCSFTNRYVSPCEDKPNGDWAHSVVDSDQQKRKDGSNITDPNRTHDEKVLGAADWVANGSTGFFSLGFGGSVTVEFENYVPNVAGNDLAVHEATNGTYSAETATVEVSQNGSTWKTVGTASNTNAGKISYFDIDSTGYLWIKFVRVTDTSNPALHSNDADGFDVDAIKATKTVCKAPEEPKVCKVTIVSDVSNTVEGAPAKLVTFINDAWDAVVNAPSKWIWGDDPVVDPVGETNQTFLKKFGWNGPVTSAILTIAADNSYNVTVNGDVFGGDAGEYNFLAADTHNLTAFIEQGNNELEIAVKNWPLANGTTETNPAGLKYELVITGTDAECDIPYEEPEERLATVVAHKIVCTNEAELPNWGATEGYSISSTTAQNWVDTHESCEFEKGWEFQWAPQNTANPDNLLPSSALYGAAGGNWTTFGPTDVNGKTTVALTASQIAGMDNIWLREVLKTGFIPFTYGPNNMSNANNYTAEMYCHTDVFNYDNYDRVDGITVDNTYYCVAWNHAEKPAPICNPEVNLIANGGFEAPAVTNEAGWDIFDLSTYPALAWAVEWVNGTGAPEEASLELHGGVNGWLPAAGEQHAELDSDWQGPGGPSGENASVMISQTVPTIAGKEYSLSWKFSPRPGTSVYQNELEVLVNNVVVETNSDAGGANTVWTPDNYVFIGTGAPVTVAFADAGLGNSEGTLLDEVSLTCREPEDDEEHGDDTYRIEGFVWNDDNNNEDWDGNEEYLEMEAMVVYMEAPLGGWVVKATKDAVTYSTTTDEYGYYYFDVPAGTWTISQEVQSGWEQTTEPEVWVVTVPVPDMSSQTLVERVLAYVVPVAHAALVDIYGDYNFGNRLLAVITPDTPNGGGGGGGGRLNRAGATQTVAGIGGDLVTPEGAVLGDQVSVVPYGAPGTGRGGAATPTGFIALLQLFALARRSEVVK